VFRKRVAVLVAAAVMVLYMLAAAAPAFAARPDCFGTSCGASLEHRANPSGEGNFGQCHKMGFVEGKESRTLNPSAQNSGEADCRTVSGREGDVEQAAIAICGPGEEATSEATQTLGHPGRTFTMHSFAHCTG
jgi:hypothetical protein